MKLNNIMNNSAEDLASNLYWVMDARIEEEALTKIQKSFDSMSGKPDKGRGLNFPSSVYGEIQDVMGAF